ncbi:hypothetical protein EVA_09545, partial [gut metagenome]
ALRIWESLSLVGRFLSEGRQRLTPFASQIVIEVFVVIITFEWSITFSP